MENHEPVAVTQGIRRIKYDEMAREPPTKSRSRVVKNLIEGHVDVSKSAMLGGYKAGSEEEGTSSKSPTSTKKLEAKEDGVVKRLEKLSKNYWLNWRAKREPKAT